jgi:hypothetical protein
MLTAGCDDGGKGYIGTWEGGNDRIKTIVTFNADGTAQLIINGQALPDLIWEATEQSDGVSIKVGEKGDDGKPENATAELVYKDGKLLNRIGDAYTKK